MKKFFPLLALPIFISLNACDGGSHYNDHAVECDSAAILQDHMSTHEDLISTNEDIASETASCDWDFGFTETTDPKKIDVYVSAPMKGSEATWVFNKISFETTLQPGKDPSTQILRGKVKINTDPKINNQGVVLGKSVLDLNAYPQMPDSVYLTIDLPPGGGVGSTLGKRKKKGLMGYDGDTITP